MLRCWIAGVRVGSVSIDRGFRLSVGRGSFAIA